jgi:hypothetical protein
LTVSTLSFIERMGQTGAMEAPCDWLEALGTVAVPSLDEDEPHQHHDWVLIRKKGLELGFADAAYFAGQPEDQWRSAGLIFSQLTFYSDTRDGVRAYAGELPHGLLMSDTQSAVRRKLAALEATRRSYITDCWETERYRLVVAYKPDDGGLDSVHLKLRMPPLPEVGRRQPTVAAQQWSTLFGLPAGDAALTAALAPLDIAQRIADHEDDREVAFLEECGLVLYFERGSQLRLARTPPRRGKVLGAVKFFRARDLDARQYTGELPFGLSFDTNPAALEALVGRPPDRRSDGNLTGHALWHLPGCSLHVLYSTVENHLFRVMLMAPGYWQDMQPVAP